MREFEKNGFCAREVHIECAGKYGELASHNIGVICKMMAGIQECNTLDDVDMNGAAIGGYVLCCTNSGFISGKSADELMEVVMLAIVSQKKKISTESDKSAFNFKAFRSEVRNV